MACTPADLRALDLAGLFANLTDPQLQSELDHAACFVCDEELWGCKLDRAQCLYAAHNLSRFLLGGGSAPAGPVTGEAAGGLSRSYGSLSGRNTESTFSSTVFGQQFLELRNTLPSTPLVLGTDC